jgi:hypothetical protein
MPKTPDATPPTYEGCTVTPGTAEQEVTEATTCTLTSVLEYVTKDYDTRATKGCDPAVYVWGEPCQSIPSSDPAAGSCALATGSGSCAYQAAVAGGCFYQADSADCVPALK